MYFCNMNRILLEVISLTYSNSMSGAYALILGNKNDDRRIPIIIGSSEAQSIALALEGVENKRPLTHDIFKTFADSFNINISEVVINRFHEGLFFAELHCGKDNEDSIIDIRPSDAIAIALRVKCPIYTTFDVMDEVGIILDDSDIENNNEDNEVLLEDSNYDNMNNYSLHDLETLLQNAIEREDYMMASVYRDEIKKRKDE